MKNQKRLYQESLKWIGKEASPFDSAPDDLACVESLASIIRYSIIRDFPIELATWRFLTLLRNDKRFKATLDLTAGNIILSPSWSGNGKIRGHTGILGEKHTIMSNSSSTGLWEENYTIDNWIKRYRNLGGMPIYVFEPLGEYDDPTKELVEKLEKENKTLSKENVELKDVVKSLVDYISQKLKVGI